MKKLTKIFISFLVLIILLGVFLYFEATHFSIRRLDIREETITSHKIPKTSQVFKVGYFSDIHYNLFMDQKRLELMVSKLNDQAVDVVLFGGDLVSDIDNHPLSSQKQSELIQALGQIKAPLGKFAVLGEGDLESEYTKTLTSSILIKSNFEVLNNMDLTIVNQNQQEMLKLYGINQQGKADIIKQKSQEFDKEIYTVLLAHKASQLSLVKSENIDLVLAGHIHGGQINLPVFREPFIGLEIYTQPTQYQNKTRIDISNGVSQRIKNVRLFANPQISIYTFKHH